MNYLLIKIIKANLLNIFILKYKILKKIKDIFLMLLI